MEFYCHNCNKQVTASYLRRYEPGYIMYFLGDRAYNYWGCGRCGKNSNMRPCNVCGHGLSNKAHTCPQCGDPKGYVGRRQKQSLDETDGMQKVFR